MILRHPALGPGCISSSALVSAASTARMMGEGDNDGEEEEDPLLAVLAVSAVAR